MSAARIATALAAATRDLGAGDRRLLVASFQDAARAAERAERPVVGRFWRALAHYLEDTRDDRGATP